MKSIVNREARSKYEYLDSWEGGLLLTGAEVKSIKGGGLNLKGAYVLHENGELWLKNAHVSAYQVHNQEDYDPERSRKVLLKRKEIDSIMGKLNESGLTLVPEKVYSKSGLVKIRIALAKGLKAADKRQKIKKRDTDRKIARALRQKM